MSKAEFEKWQRRIGKAEKAYEEYHELIRKIRKYYKNDKAKNKNNIFWSSIETLKPFLYFKEPKVYVDRKSKLENPIESTAAAILEKALEWDLSQFDIDSVIKYARNDYLLSGAGMLYERYVPTFKKIVQDVPVATESGEMVMSQQEIEIIDSEKIISAYIDPVDFIADCEKVGVWEDVTWVARVIYMTRSEAAKQFGKNVDSFSKDEEDTDDKNVKVYEIWDKPSKSVIYWCDEYKIDVLKQKPLPDIGGVFPMPKPIFTTLTNDSIIPVPDYSEIKSLLEELDGVNNRMRLTMQALKVSGCYDNSFPELANILDKDVTLVALSDFDKLKESGGISGIIDFMPIEQYINSLQAMAQRRADIVQNIYEITGVSDIMRGNSDPNETATAVNKKTNFGTLRNQDRQNDMQRFITDLLQIKAEMICELFDRETLARFATPNHQNVPAAIELLKTDRMRNLIVGIETDTTFTQLDMQNKIIEVVQLISQMISEAFPAISAQPLLLPLYRQMINSVIITLPNARQFEPVIENVFKQISAQLSQPEPQQPNPDLLKVQFEEQKNQQEYAIKQEQNAIKREELALKSQVDNRKLDLTRDEMILQDKLKTAELAIKGNTNANVTTGLVKGF